LFYQGSQGKLFKDYICCHWMALECMINAPNSSILGLGFVIVVDSKLSRLLDPRPRVGKGHCYFHWSPLMLLLPLSTWFVKPLTYGMCFQKELLNWRATNGKLTTCEHCFVFEDPKSQIPDPKYFHISSFNFKAHWRHSSSQESSSNLHHNPLYEIIGNFILVTCV
jgi:hypothetical protein